MRRWSVMLSPAPSIGRTSTAAWTNTIGSRSAVAPPWVNASVTASWNCPAKDISNPLLLSGRLGAASPALTLQTGVHPSLHLSRESWRPCVGAGSLSSCPLLAGHELADDLEEL